ncbi:MAG: hypothetical protein Q7J43_14525 [Pseudomonas sp.]|uniref:hypothetical protein n=1 Tax=Pseudomonas sp. TaxID=306 RepID=UPI002721B251|nr:hypothetical protein [Pseudomonas sp.]MDO9618878.1 hypothetical protein [Pseudomonas sp.]MDP2444211.1 hypothetical protein [Pseudomonas sp.]MDZ4338573.1 hypothetical protein [Pseudomonas sp.]
MLPIRSLALLLTVLSLAACEQSTNPPVKAKAETVNAQPAPEVVTSKAVKAEPAPVVSKPAQPKAAEAKPAAAAQTKPKPAVVAREPAPAEPKAPLDLSLHTNVFDPLQPVAPLSDLSIPLLPPMFGDKDKTEGPFQLNGKLITNERGDDYWESVEGAQLQFEFKQ